MSFFAKAQSGTEKTNFQKASSKGRLTGDCSGPTSIAALLGIVVNELHAAIDDPIDVWCFVPNNSDVLRTDVCRSNVIGQHEQDVWLFLRHWPRTPLKQRHIQARLTIVSFRLLPLNSNFSVVRIFAITDMVKRIKPNMGRRECNKGERPVCCTEGSLESRIKQPTRAFCKTS